MGTLRLVCLLLFLFGAFIPRGCLSAAADNQADASSRTATTEPIEEEDAAATVGFDELFGSYDFYKKFITHTEDQLHIDIIRHILQTLHETLLMNETDREALLLKVEAQENQHLYKFFDSRFNDPTLSLLEADTLDHLKEILASSQDFVDTMLQGKVQATMEIQENIRKTHLILINFSVANIDFPLKIYIKRWLPFFQDSIQISMTFARRVFLPGFVFFFLWVSLRRS